MTDKRALFWGLGLTALLLPFLCFGVAKGQEVVLTDSTANWKPVFSLQEWMQHSPEMGVVHGAMLNNAPIALERPNHKLGTEYLQTDGALWRDPWTGTVPVHLIPMRDVGVLSSYGQRTTFSSVKRQSPKPVIELDFFERGQEDRTINLLYGQNLSESIHVEIAYSTINEQGDYDGFQGEYSTLRTGLRWEPDSTQTLHFKYSTYSSKQTESQGIQGYSPNGFSFNPLIESPIYPFVRVEPFTKRLQSSWVKLLNQTVTSTLGLSRDVQETDLTNISTLEGSTSLDWFSQRTQLFSTLELKTPRSSYSGSFWLEHTSIDSKTMSFTKNSSWFTGLELNGNIAWTSQFRSTFRSNLMNSTNQSSSIGEVRMDHSWQSSLLELTVGLGHKAHYPSLLQSNGVLAPVVGAPQWSHAQMASNTSLDPKTISFFEFRPSLKYQSWKVFGSMAFLLTDDEWLRKSDGSWENGPSYSSIQGSLTASVKVKDVTMRLGGHAMDMAVKQKSLNGSECVDCISIPSTRDLRLAGWGQLELERPFFDQATYVKMGVTLRAAPLQQAGWIWSPWLQQWIRADHQLELPSTATVDAYLSARLRWMMIYMRMDQASDQLWQRGTMDSYGVPKSGRRFIFGIRVLFKN